MATQALDQSRTVLIKAVEKLSDAELAFTVNSKSKSIGESLLHIAAFEYLASGAVARKEGKPVDKALWSRLAPGFAREAGFPAPKKLSKSDYQELLNRARAITQSVAGIDQKVAESDLTIFIDELRSSDGANARLYDELLKAMKLSNLVHGPDAGLAFLLQSHESYHRGQIFFHRHLVVA